MTKYCAAFTTIEFILLVSVIILTSLSITFQYADEGIDPEQPIKIPFELPSNESQTLSHLLANKMIMNQQFELSHELFSTQYDGYYNTISHKKQYDRMKFANKLEEKFRDNIFYRPKLIQIKYFRDNFICYWVNGVDQYGIPSSRDPQTNSIGVSLYKVNNGKIIKGIHFNTKSVGPDEIFINLPKQ